MIDPFPFPDIPRLNGKPLRLAADCVTSKASLTRVRLQRLAEKLDRQGTSAPWVTR